MTFYDAGIEPWSTQVAYIIKTYTIVNYDTVGVNLNHIYDVVKFKRQATARAITIKP